MQGGTARQINVYGRKRNTRVVPGRVAQVNDENADAERAPGTPEKSSVRGGLFAGLNLLHSRLDSPGKTPRAPMSDVSNVRRHSKVDAAPAKAPALHLDEPSAPPSLTPHEPPIHALALGENAALQRVLGSVAQDEPLSFERVLSECCSKSATLAKAGEASFSEVYKIVRGSERCVMKVIPLRGATSDDIGPALTSLDDVHREVTITSALTRLGHDDAAASHFVRLQRAAIVCGKYPQALLRAWDEYKEEPANRSENKRPDKFGNAQLYALLLMDDAGDDLEHTTLHSWESAAAIFWQTAAAIAHAEGAAKLEVREYMWP